VKLPANVAIALLRKFVRSYDAQIRALKKKWRGDEQLAKVKGEYDSLCHQYREVLRSMGRGISELPSREFPDHQVQAVFNLCQDEIQKWRLAMLNDAYDGDERKFHVRRLDELAKEALAVYRQIQSSSERLSSALNEINAKKAVLLEWIQKLEKNFRDIDLGDIPDQPPTTKEGD
jgi:phage shock protein A